MSARDLAERLEKEAEYWAREASSLERPAKRSRAIAGQWERRNDRAVLLREAAAALRQGKDGDPLIILRNCRIEVGPDRLELLDPSLKGEISDCDFVADDSLRGVRITAKPEAVA